METTPIQRLREYWDVKKIRQSHVTRSVSVTKQSVNRWFDDSKDIKALHLSEIKSKYPDLNLEWLITGKGQMLIKEEEGINILSDHPIEYENKCKSCERMEGQVELLKTLLRSREAECRELAYKLKIRKPPEEG